MKHIITLTIVLLLTITIKAQEVFELKFTVATTQYRAALVMSDDYTSGLMRVRYYSNGTKMVEQKMYAEDTKYGLRLTGYKPVYPGTSIKHASYNADNFYISKDEYGNVLITNVDDNGVVAKTFVKKVTGRYNTNKFLEDFDWELR